MRSMVTGEVLELDDWSPDQTASSEAHGSCRDRRLIALTPQQEQQIAKQCRVHRHSPYSVDLKLSYGEIVRRFAVHAGVMRPERMTSIILARFLHFANGLFRGRDCVDMGCGSGVQGIVMALRGARRVVLTDIAPTAALNAEVNVHRFGLRTCTVVAGDLFQRVEGSYDVVVFNHPFFVGQPSTALREKLQTSLSAGAFVHNALGDPYLIHRFLAQARRVLRKTGMIVMPYYHSAGEANHPAIQGPKHGYRVFEHFRTIVKTGFQQGPVSIYTLTPLDR